MTGHAPLRAASRSSESAFDASELLERIARDLGRIVSGSPFVVLTWPVPRVPSERLLGPESDGDGVLWAPPGEDEACGLGAAFTLSARGPDRFSTIQNQAHEVWPLLDSSGADELAPAPRFFGGFAFQAGRAESPLWHEFGDARFVLPKLTYLKNRGGAWLRLIVPGSALNETEFREQLEAPLRRALHALFTPGAPFEPARELSREEGSPEAWGNLVLAIQGEIAKGCAQKIVAARRLSLRLDRALSAAGVQARLREDAPESTRFAFRFGASTFLGATPEQLIRKSGLEISTEAVAGSISADDSTAAKHLLESDKDIREHEFVVSEILRLLGPLTQELSPAPRREVHRLRTVLHLRTPIQGKLREAVHVLELVGRLHPTPAVGGVPTRAAIDFIVQHEPDERGWYTGPVGWFDAQGDGRFVVALRSGVISGARAELYAGAGVVQDSNAPSEFAETRWKLAALLGALGVSG
ncbi:MAG TPA: isochorismate synthase [Polyangiaceae bacterium]|jgi:menaquinone-specific isochorismate synthase|nr:isochorismate synthase [Polyangiaceae bacterium]